MTEAANVPGAILVGTGDNFAPEIEARDFRPRPPDQRYILTPAATSPTKYYQRAQKELFTWDPANQNWVTNEQVDRDPDFQSLKEKLRTGEGTVPTDNVGCFLIQENYTAVVPGKHDFYFGPERLRELARFLASTPIPNTSPPRYVQMLGANLVIQTTWKKDHKPPSGSEAAPWFIPKFPEASDFESQKSAPNSNLKISLVGLSDGGKVYPWFSGPTLRILRIRKPGGSKALVTLVAALKASHIYLCETEGGDPNRVPRSLSDPHCRLVYMAEDKQWNDEPRKSFRLQLRFPWQDSQRTSTLLPGENYGLCVEAPYSPVRDKTGGSTFCVRFSTYIPFFQHPWGHTKEACRNPSANGCYRDPTPYAFVGKDQAPGLPEDVAIFGVVDPDILTYAGALNYRWWNDDSRYETQVVAQDPGEALKELLAYFDRRYKADDQGSKFSGIKVLLAQMSPQLAQALAARVGAFDIVVSAADHEFATGYQATAIAAIKRKAGDWGPPAFVAVPDPYYVAGRKPDPGIVQAGSLYITHPSDRKGMWQFVSYQAYPPSAAVGGVAPASAPLLNFWERVKKAVRSCRSERSKASTSQDKQTGEPPPAEQHKLIEDLTLCAMQKEAGADVVLAQKRDLFLPLPPPPEAQDLDAKLSNLQHLQQLLDRIIWKGDFLTLMYVPGSALVKAMAQSKKYDQDDASDLSLSDEKGRGLVPLGIRPDPSSGGYLINQVPLDPNRLYGVATTDYIGAGDTGYPELAAAAIKPPVVPKDFGRWLNTVSGLVCRQVAGNASRAVCLDAVESQPYFDGTNLKPTDYKLGETWAGRLWKSIVPAKRTPASTDPAERRVEQRGLGSVRINPPNASSLAIEKATFGISAVNHRFSDAELSKVLPGTNVPQLSAHRAHTITFDIRPKYTYSWNHVELFQAVEFNYGLQYTGQLVGPRIVSQTQNLFSSDTGAAFHIPDRALPHLEPVLTFHYETQLANQPLSFFQSRAGTNTTLVQPVPTSRTHYLLPRLGLRYLGQKNWIEAGLEDGEELKAIRFVPLPPAVPGSKARTLVKRPNLHVAGAYWNWHFALPFTPRVSWQNDEDGQYFFNNTGDSPEDMRFRSDVKTGLNFQVWPSLAFGPTYEFFLYSNKVQGIWFWQGQASIQMNLRFDLWNHRDWWTKQLRYKSGAQ